MIGNKRKHLERNLSASQRDQLLIKEAKEDSQFKKELAEVMRDSSAKFSESVKVIGQSITDLGAGTSRSIEMLSGAIMHQAHPLPVNQNLFYQQHQEYPLQNVPQILREDRFPSMYDQPPVQHEEAHVLPPKYI